MKKFYQTTLSLVSKATDALMLTADYSDEYRTGRQPIRNSPILLSRLALLVVVLFVLLIFCFPSMIIVE